MVKKDSELLFEYLRSIIYDKDPLDFHPEVLSADAADLGRGLHLLSKFMWELKEYAGSISKGDLDVEFPSKSNPLCLELKNLHSNLNHLTWQAKQVASGDYSQQVSYLGEFSEAFNLMIGQLRERENLLRRKLEEKEEHFQRLQNYNEMFINLTRKCKEWIIVSSLERNEILYCNKQRGETLHTEPDCVSCPCRIGIQSEILDYNYPDSGNSWESFDEKSGRWFLSNRFYIDWNGKESYVYIIEEITDDRIKEQKLSQMAYKDTMTGIYNRRYLEEQAFKYMKAGEPFTFCYIDLDNLKYINDNFGHGEGDRYICYIVSRLSSGLDERDIFARIGGDEFVILSPKQTESGMREYMQSVYNSVYEEIHRGTAGETMYRAGFSFGIVGYYGEKGKTVEGLLDDADIQMYKCKQDHR